MPPNTVPGKQLPQYTIQTYGNASDKIWFLLEGGTELELLDNRAAARRYGALHQRRHNWFE